MKALNDSVGIFKIKNNTESTTTENDTEQVFTAVEQMPQFPGGDVELSLYIHKNTERQEVYSGELDADGNQLLVTGEVLVQFVIDRCGKPGRFQIIQSLTEEQDAEALRVIESLPIFRSASIDGIRVKSAYIAPVKFQWKTMPPKKEEPSYESTDFFDEWDASSDDEWW